MSYDAVLDLSAFVCMRVFLRLFALCSVMFLFSVLTEQEKIKSANGLRSLIFFLFYINSQQKNNLLSYSFRLSLLHTIF